MKLYLTLLAVVLAPAVHAQTVNIDQAKALAGNVTSGDAPGFPVIISQPGSYRLSGPLTVADANLGGILITAPNVTLDLGGFTVTGGRCTSSGCVSHMAGVHGIRIDGPASNVRVSNGTVDAFGSSGVSSGARGTTVSGVTLRRNGGAAATFANEFVLQDSRIMDVSGYVTIIHQDRGTIRHGEFDATPGNILSILSSDGYPVLLDGNRFRNSAGKAFDAGRALSLGNNMCNTAAC